MLTTERVALLSIHSSPLAPVGTQYAGGMNIYVQRLADELVRRGVDVDVFTRRTSASDPEVLELPSGARLVNLVAGPARTLPKSVLPLHIPRIVAAFRDFSERHRRTYDVLHSHYWLSGFVAARARPDASVPLVHMFHTLALVKQLFDGSMDPRDSALRPDGERCVAGSADAIIGATAGEEEYIRRLYGRTPKRFEVIPPGVNPDLFRPLDPTASRKALGIGAERVILFVGRYDKIKGLEALLSIVAGLRDRIPDPIRLVVVGTEQDRGGRHPIRLAAARLHLDDIIDIRGTIPHNELPRYYCAADVLAVPSVYESFGMAAVESIACGTPVVAYRVGGLAETVRHGLSGFLAAPGNRQEFGYYLQSALLQSRGDQQRERISSAAATFRWQHVASETLALYDDLLWQHRFSFTHVSGLR